MITLLFYLITAILRAIAGGKINEHFGYSYLFGALIGFVFHIPGLCAVAVFHVIMSMAGKGAGK